jgi:DNA processing protein
MEDILDLLTAALLPGLRPRAVRELRARGPLAEALRRPSDHADLLTGRARAAASSGETRGQAEEQVRLARGLAVALVGWDSPDYPERLRQIYDPPPVLYVRGCLQDDGARAVAVVGARAATPAGLALARTMAGDLAGAGLVIVSGLARGIDAAAHQGALDGGGRTVAVLGSGLDRLYPREHAPLADRIVEGGGAIVSEFPLGSEARPERFPRRNRIIAGWSRAVVVVEASERSGALVTARVALEEGRDVMAVPGHPSHPSAAGTNGLLRDGATLVRGAADVAAELGVVLGPLREPEGDMVLKVLTRDRPLTVDELSARLRQPPSEVLGRLLALELEDRVRRLPGALYVRS